MAISFKDKVAIITGMSVDGPKRQRMDGSDHQKLRKGALMAISFAGKVAIVTGAGGGLGRSHALELARRGAKIVVNDLGGSLDGSGGNSEAAEKVVAEIKAAGGEAIANGASVSDDAGVAHLVKQTMDAYGRCDILIANAGILRDKSFAKMEIADFNAVMAVHLMGTVKPCKALWPIMKAQAYGRIVVTTSGTGLYGNFGQTNYGAAKLALVGFMNSLKLEGAERRQYQGQCRLPGRRHPHDRKSDAAGGTGNAQARICLTRGRLSGQR